MYLPQVMGSVQLINSRQESFGLEQLAGQYVAVYFSAHWVRSCMLMRIHQTVNLSTPYPESSPTFLLLLHWPTGNLRLTAALSSPSASVPRASPSRASSPTPTTKWSAGACRSRWCS